MDRTDDNQPPEDGSSNAPSKRSADNSNEKENQSEHNPDDDDPEFIGIYRARDDGSNENDAVRSPLRDNS